MFPRFPRFPRFFKLYPVTPGSVKLEIYTGARVLAATVLLEYTRQRSEGNDKIEIEREVQNHTKIIKVLHVLSLSIPMINV